MSIRPAIPLLLCSPSGVSSHKVLRLHRIVRGIRPASSKSRTTSKRFQQPRFGIEPDKVYSLAELVDLAETTQSRDACRVGKGARAGGGTGRGAERTVSDDRGGGARADGPRRDPVWKPVLPADDSDVSGGVGAELHDFRFRRAGRSNRRGKSGRADSELRV